MHNLSMYTFCDLLAYTVIDAGYTFHQSWRKVISNSIQNLTYKGGGNHFPQTPLDIIICFHGFTKDRVIVQLEQRLKDQHHLCKTSLVSRKCLETRYQVPEVDSKIQVGIK